MTERGVRLPRSFSRNRTEFLSGIIEKDAKDEGETRVLMSVATGPSIVWGAVGELGE